MAVDVLGEVFYGELVDEVLLGLAFEVHRAKRIGLFDLEDGGGDSGPTAPDTVNEEAGLDVFGQLPVKNKQHECVCPNCQRNLAAARFAPHLEKCMGMGRNSSRIASRRIANNSKDTNAYGTFGASDDDNDDDWTMSSSDKRRKKREKNSPRKPAAKAQKLRNGDVVPPTATGATTDGTSDITTAAANYEHMSSDERRALLSHICGVISEHTKRLCTRSQRCPQHSEDQRRTVRENLLGAPDTVTVDVDTVDEVDSVALSTTSSPADSTSTSNSSSSSKKRDKSGKNKKKVSSAKNGNQMD